MIYGCINVCVARVACCFINLLHKNLFKTNADRLGRKGEKRNNVYVVLTQVR